MTDSDNDPGALRLLVLVRHAQADTFSLEGDIGRTLTAHGRGQADELGRWLLGQGVRADLALLSPAARARQTADGMAAGGLDLAAARIDQAIYNGASAAITESIGAVDDEIRTLVVVGHAPGIPALAGALPDHREGGPGPGDGWPPAAAAVVCHDGPWSTFPSPASAIVAFHLPH